MGTLYQPSYKIPLPDGAEIKKNRVVWISKGEPKSGTRSGKKRVLVHSKIWELYLTTRVLSGCLVSL